MTDPGLATQDPERHMAPATSAHNKPLSRDTTNQTFSKKDSKTVFSGLSSLNLDNVEYRSAHYLLYGNFLPAYIYSREKYEV